MGRRVKRGIEDGERVIELPKKVKEFIAEEVCKLGLKDPGSGKYVIGRRMSQALHKLLEVLVENVQDDFRSHLVLHLLQDVKLIDLHLLPLLDALILPDDALEAEMALSLMKLLLLAPMSKEIVQLQRALKKAFAKSALALMNLIVQVCLNEEFLNSQVKARVFTMILTVLRALFVLPDLPYFLKEGDNRMARNSHLLKALQKCTMIDFLMAATNDQENPLILGRKREILLLWAAIFSSVNAEQSSSSFLGGEEKIVKKPIRHGRFSGAVIVQLTTGQEVLLQSTSQILDTTNSVVDLLNLQKKSARKQPRLEYLPHYTLLSQAELQCFQAFVSLFTTSCLSGLIETFLSVTEKLETDENLHCSVFALFAFLLTFSSEPALVMALVQPQISQRAGHLLHKWLPMGRELSVACLNICLYLSASLDLLALLKNCANVEEYLEVAERNLCSQYDLMHGVSMLFTSMKSPTPNTLKKLTVISSSVIKGMQRYCEGKALLYVSKRRAKKDIESEEDEYEDFYKELSFPDYEEVFFTSIIVERLLSLFLPGNLVLTEREQVALADLLERVLRVKGGLVLRLRYMMFVYEALRTRVFVKELDTVLLRVLVHVMDSCQHNLDYLFLLFASTQKSQYRKFVEVVNDDIAVHKEEKFGESSIEVVIEMLQELEEVAIALWILEKISDKLQSVSHRSNEMNVEMNLFDDDQVENRIKFSLLADIDVRKQKLKLPLVRRFLHLLELIEMEGVWTLELQRESVNSYYEKLENIKDRIRKGATTPTTSLRLNEEKQGLSQVTKEASSSNDNFNSYVEEEETTTEEDDGKLPTHATWVDRLRHVQFLKKRRREEYERILVEEEETDISYSYDNEDGKRLMNEQEGEKENNLLERTDQITPQILVKESNVHQTLLLD